VGRRIGTGVQEDFNSVGFNSTVIDTQQLLRMLKEGESDLLKKVRIGSGTGRGEFRASTTRGFSTRS
jgi:hypothetical protein